MLELGHPPALFDEILRQPAQRAADLFTGNAHRVRSVASGAPPDNEAGTPAERVPTLLHRHPRSSRLSAMPPGRSTPEHKRLEEARTGAAPWKAWGPYLSERQWGTVREDYSADGDAWNYFPHDHARSRAYRWGEDGIAGICDERQRLCFALALWNGADPILKERMFGLSNGEGNHGEDVKEYWFYLDCDAHALLPEVPVQVPAARVPVLRPGRRPTAAAASWTWSTSCSTPASSTRTATST